MLPVYKASKVKTKLLPHDYEYEVFRSTKTRMRPIEVFYPEAIPLSFVHRLIAVVPNADRFEPATITEFNTRAKGFEEVETYLGAF
jgi:hypothetical protein